MRAPAVCSARCCHAGARTRNRRHSARGVSRGGRQAGTAAFRVRQGTVASPKSWREPACGRQRFLAEVLLLLLRALRRSAARSDAGPLPGWLPGAARRLGRGWGVAASGADAARAVSVGPGAEQGLRRATEKLASAGGPGAAARGQRLSLPERTARVPGALLRREAEPERRGGRRLCGLVHERAGGARIFGVGGGLHLPGGAR